MIIALLLSVFLLLPIPVHAAVSGGTYLTVDTTELGTIKIYIDDTYKDSFGVNGSGIPLLLRGSSITGYTLNSNDQQQYRITIGSYGNDWQYRNASGTTTTYTLHVLSWDRDNSNIVVSGVDFDYSLLVSYLILFFGLLIVIILWSKRR